MLDFNKQARTGLPVNKAYSQEAKFVCRRWNTL